MLQASQGWSINFPVEVPCPAVQSQRGPRDSNVAHVGGEESWNTCLEEDITQGLKVLLDNFCSSPLVQRVVPGMKGNGSSLGTARF
jgi:hypothetical protein